MSEFWFGLAFGAVLGAVAALVLMLVVAAWMNRPGDESPRLPRIPDTTAQEGGE